MSSRFIKRRLLRARITLKQTVSKILEINHRRKKLSFRKNPLHEEQMLSEELRVLNKIVEQQAKLVRRYESALSDRRETETRTGRNIR